MFAVAAWHYIDAAYRARKAYGAWKGLSVFHGRHRDELIYVLQSVSGRGHGATPVHEQAERRLLPRVKGYLYRCAACGGRFEMCPGAQGHAERGEMRPEVVQMVRQVLAAGRRPRVEWNARCRAGGNATRFVIEACCCRSLAAERCFH